MPSNIPTTFFDWVRFLIEKYGDMFLRGTGVTLLVALTGTILGFVLGLLVAILRTVPLLQFSKSAPEDLDTGQEDHAADEWRYACMSRPVTPLREVPAEAFTPDPLGRWQA